jgi:predicted ArsR family transcriptional regulator
MSEQALVERALGNRSRARVYAALRDAHEPLDASQLGELVGLHPNTVRWHIDHLVDAGLVAARSQPLDRPGRPRVVYETSAEEEPQNPAREDHRLLATVLAGALAEQPDGPKRAVEAGEAWGRFLVERPEPGVRTPPAEAMGEITRVLDDQGFEPEVSGLTLRMHHCPFRELAEKHASVVCGMHHGLVAGALEELRTTVTADQLTPFAEPGVCVLRFSV